MSVDYFTNPKGYFQEYWREMTPDERLRLFTRMDHELHAPPASEIDRTLYTSPLSVTIEWMRELITEDRENAKVAQERS
jgi:hypothetical protein